MSLVSLDLVRRLSRRIDNFIARAKVTLVDDGSAQQRVQLQTGPDEVLDDCERFQPYGFSAVPNVGAEAIAVFAGGRRDHPLVLAVDDRRTRLNGLQPGEVCIYTDQGDYVIIRRGGAIEIKGATSVTITTPSAKFTGSLEVDGDCDFKGNVNVEGSSGITVPNGDVVAGAIDLKHHTHTGVASGGSNTGPPV